MSHIYVELMGKLRGVLSLALLAGILLGCAGQRYRQEGERLLNEGKIEAGLEKLRQAKNAEPGNLEFRQAYANRLQRETTSLSERAQTARDGGKLTAARELYFAVLNLDKSNELARRGIAEVDMDIRHGAILVEVEKLLKTGRLDAASERLSVVRHESPGNLRAQGLARQLADEIDAQRRGKEAAIDAQSILKRPVTLQFRDANIRMAFEALSRTTGLNVIFDRDVRSDLKTTIFVREGSVEDTVDLILLQNQLEKKVLNANTMLIYPATPAKQKEFQELKVRTFRISNGDAKYIQGMLKSILKIKEVQVDERTNTLVLRDTPEALAVAESVIAAHDLPDAEVMLEFEVLEISRDRLSNIGINWPSNVTVATPTDSGGGLTLGSLRNIRRDQLLVTPLQVGLNFKLQDTDASLLASPRIRVRDREKAKILIGDKVPVITNTVTPVSTGAAVVTGSIQYIDVGIKLEVEPHVYEEGEVGIKLNLEVSNIAKEISGPGGSLAYQIGTRMASTSLRLRDGETQMLGGLISDSDRTTAAKVPGLGQLPLLGRLFSNNDGNKTKTEIVLSITPHIVRAKGVAEDHMVDAWSGTEANVRGKPMRLDPVLSVSAAPASPNKNPNVVAAQPYQSAQPAQQGVFVAGESSAPSSAVSPGVMALSGTVTVPIGVQPKIQSAVTQDTSEASPPVPAPTAVPVIPPTTRPAEINHGSIEGREPLSAQPGKDDVGGAALSPQMVLSAPGVIKVGDQFNVSVNAANFTGVSSVPVVMQFDPQVLSFVALTVGELAARVGIGADPRGVDQNAGRVNFTLNAEQMKSMTGSGELLAVTFVARRARPQTQVQLAAVDLKQGRIPHTIRRPQPLILKVEP